MFGYALRKIGYGLLVMAGVVTVAALEMSDFPVVMGSILFIALVFVVINILIDILYAYLDPRVKLA